MRRLRHPFHHRIQATSFEGYAPTAIDVWVGAHPKSGTNGLLQICVQIADRGAARFEHIHHVVPWSDCPPSTSGCPAPEEAKDEEQGAHESSEDTDMCRAARATSWDGL